MIGLMLWGVKQGHYRVTHVLVYRAALFKDSIGGHTQARVE